MERNGVYVAGKTMELQIGASWEEKLPNAPVIGFKPKYLVRGIPTDYRLPSHPSGLWHTHSPVYGEFYRQNLPAPSTLSSPTSRGHTPGQASHFIILNPL